MTKEQADEEYVKLRQQHHEDRKKIMKEAEEQGVWMGGLDTNRELFIELDKSYREKIKLLKLLIDEN